jgi:hypothetical protein
MQLKVTVVSIILILALTACAGSIAPTPTSAPTAVPQAKIEPEKIVQQFLTDFQEAPLQLAGYLSPTLQQSTPVQDYAKLLPVTGMIEGFSVQSVSRSGAEAEVTVALRAGGSETNLLFNLVEENQNWYINSITKAP